MNFKKIIISIVAFVFIFAVIVFAQAKINLSKIPNGTYLGNYKATYKGTRQGDYQVKATVSDGKLTRVVLTKSGPARSKEAYDKMIAANDIYVDGITGATWKALLEDAFTKLTPAK